MIDARRRAPRHADSRSGGAEGNERLTAASGAVLLILLAVEGLTILSLRQGLLSGRTMRRALVFLSLTAGLIIAVLTAHLAAPWQAVGVDG
jgi:hypothetical protein